MTRTEIEETRKQIKSQITILVAQLCDESKTLYTTHKEEFREYSIMNLIYERIGSINKETENTYHSLLEDFRVLKEIQLLHCDLFRLDLLEQH